MLYIHRITGEVRTVEDWMQYYGWTEEIQFDEGSDDLIAVDESEVCHAHDCAIALNARHDCSCGQNPSFQGTPHETTNEDRR